MDILELVYFVDDCGGDPIIGDKYTCFYFRHLNNTFLEVSAGHFRDYTTEISKEAFIEQYGDEFIRKFVDFYQKCWSEILNRSKNAKQRITEHSS